MKTRFKPVIAVALAGLVFGAYGWGRAQGQGEGQMTGDDFYNLRRNVEEKPGQATYAALVNAYVKAPNNPLVVQEIASNALSRGQSEMPSLLVLQAMQNQKLIEQNKAMMEQNARIIALLEAPQKGK